MQYSGIGLRLTLIGLALGIAIGVGCSGDSTGGGEGGAGATAGPAGSGGAASSTTGMGMGQNAQQGTNQGMGEGDPMGGEKLKNARSSANNATGDGSIIQLRKKERYKVQKGAEAQYPAEIRERIKQYNVNVKNAKPAPGK